MYKNIMMLLLYSIIGLQILRQTNVEVKIEKLWVKITKRTHIKNRAR